MSQLTELFAYLTTANGAEEIATYEVLGNARPLVAVDRQHALGMQPMARTVADDSKAPLRLIRFAPVEELTVVEPTA